MALYNPFARRQEISSANILTYRILTISSWIVSVIPSFYYLHHIPGHIDSSKPNPDDPDNVHNPPHIHHHRQNTLFGQSYAHPTPFTINHVFVAIYWISLFLGQLGYVWHLFVSNDLWVKAACTVGPHFILFNLLHFLHITLWTRGQFLLGEIVLIVNFLQLTALYFRHSLPRTADSQILSLSKVPSIHLPAVAMPLVWTYFALFWNGAVMVRCHDAAVCRILANVAIWGIVPFAGTFLFGYGDWTVGFATAFLTAGLGVGQFFIKTFALQWIFAFTIMGLVFLATLPVAYPGARTSAVGERAPLLHEDA
jgi:hypothetical protein